MALSVPDAVDIGDQVRLGSGPVKYRIGLVALSTDHMIEVDFARLLPHEDVGLYVSRVEFINPVTVENLRRMEPDIAAAAALILPGEDLDALCYGCTAASATIGDEGIDAALDKGKPGTVTTNPARAALAAMRALNVEKLSLLTPYPAAASQEVATYFDRQGVRIISHHCLGISHDVDIARVERAALIEAAVNACHPEAEAMFLSCTALPAVSVIPALEDRLGRPVISSNQATLWMALRLAGCSASPPAGGRLFTLDLAAADQRLA
ncbi:ectoine utilization protein EutA [Alphaproteobacteria bacterium LSUCC0684]